MTYLITSTPNVKVRHFDGALLSQHTSVSLDDLRSFRRLTPAFTLGNNVFCWECSLCHKLFLQTPHDSPPNHSQMVAIYSEFEHHDCTLQLTIVREKLKRA